jgi:hypothetical protein
VSHYLIRYLIIGHVCHQKCAKVVIVMRDDQINNTAPPEVVSVRTADDPFGAPGLDSRFAFYRAVNERIREVNAGFAVFADNFEVFCECGARDCLERVEVPAKVYDDVLSGPRCLVKAGHESPGHGVVVAESGSYVVIEADASTRREARCSSTPSG